MTSPPREADCLTDTLLVELIDGRIQGEMLTRTYRHLDACPQCHGLVAELLADDPPENGARVPPLEKVKEPPRIRGSRTQREDPWEPPREFDHFRDLRLLGRGGMGVVYQAEDVKLGRRVALKFIAAQQPAPQLHERFQHEARAIAKIQQHRNVVTVYSSGEVAGRPYFASEFLAGQPLSKLRPPLAWKRVLELGVGLSRGLAAAHRAGVLHRDITPANIFVPDEGDVKLLDFGLAEFVPGSQAKGPNTLRITGGTPPYMAPELFEGASASPTSDLYSLGVVLHELCTGKLPPQQHELMRRFYLPRRESGPDKASGGTGSASLLEQVPDIDRDFAALITRCLCPEPGERITSAEDLHAALALLEQPHRPDLLPHGNPYRGLAPFEPEHRALFFGREGDIREVLDRLRDAHLVLVAGESGVGKSSLCRAGVLPRVTESAFDKAHGFSTVILEPGRRPLEALSAALAPHLKRTAAELSTQLTDSPRDVAKVLREACTRRRGLCLFVDQLEELITLGEPGQAARFTEFLTELVSEPSHVRVLLAVRGDFIGRVGTLPGMSEVVEKRIRLLNPLAHPGVRAAITRPVYNRGVSFENSLLEALVEATGRSVGSLPLLQFTLAELWERRSPGQERITLADLEAMGGMAGALSRHADAVLNRMGLPEQHAAREIFCQLITAEGTRGSRSEEELHTLAGASHTALRALLEGRLIHARTVAGGTSYEIAHEVLLQHWGTLRDWMDANRGERALRQRIEAASVEWERLGRSRDILWRGRQLEEARDLTASTLGSREEHFLLESRRAARRQRWGRGLIVFAVALALGCGYGVKRWQEHVEMRNTIHTAFESAHESFVRATESERAAHGRLEKALSLFNGQEPGGRSRPLDSEQTPSFWMRANAVWSTALHEFSQTKESLDDAETRLNDVLRVQNDADARKLLKEVLKKRILLAELLHSPDGLSSRKRRLAELVSGDGVGRDSLETLTDVEFVLDPPDTHVEIDEYVQDDEGLLRRQPVLGLGPLGVTPLSRVSLPMGSYHLRFTHEERVPVDLPLFLNRDAHERVTVTLPSSVPEGYVYIPPGRFFMGSSDPEPMRNFLQSAPLHMSQITEGYVIGKFEVTLADWLAYVNTLPAKAPERGYLAQPVSSNNGSISLKQDPQGTWVFSLRESNGQSRQFREGERVHYPGRDGDQDWRQFPLTGVSFEQLQPYFKWLNTTQRLPGARLCSEAEWVRAASGSDDRKFPHGNTLLPTDANIDETYGFVPGAVGPDEVGKHPNSASPFGLQDLAGNAFEMTRPLLPEWKGRVFLHGGAWTYGSVGALITNRQPMFLSGRDATVGLRLCASFPLD